MAATMGGSGSSVREGDDLLTMCAISLVAAMIANVVHEGLGHAATALLTGTQSGVLTTVAWSSYFDSRLVAAAGTLANLAAGVVFWIGLRRAAGASVRLRFFLLISLAFNLFTGTGYFFFSGATNFGDWAVVIGGFAGPLVVADAAGCRWDCSLLRCGLGCGQRLGAIRGSGAGRCAAAVEIHFNSLPIGDAAGLRGWTVESAGHTTGLAIGLAGDGRG